MKVPVVDLKAAYNEQRDELNRTAIEVLESGYYVSGPRVAELEKSFSEYLDVSRAVAVSSGTEALRLALLALNVGVGDEILTPSFTFFACASMISAIGAKPVFVDIDPHDFNIDPDDIKKRTTPKTRGIIAVHMFGHPVRMKEIMGFAKEHSLFVIEDCAQAIGAKYVGKYVGSIGTMGTFSFYPTKNLHACGEGGMIVGDDEALLEKAKLFRNHGENPRYYHHVLGINARMHELQAAFIKVKMKLLDKWNNRRREIAAMYDAGFTGLDIKIPPQPVDSILPSYNTYTIRTSRRDELKAFLDSHEIGTMIYYPLPLHLQPVFKNLGYKKGEFPESEKACEEVLSLPVHPYLNDEQVDYVIGSIRNFFA
jgi:dTDP-4-amino-4,6-dideoxygalactose transaminase